MSFFGKISRTRMILADPGTNPLEDPIQALPRKRISIWMLLVAVWLLAMCGGGAYALMHANGSAKAAPKSSPTYFMTMFFTSTYTPIPTPTLAFTPWINGNSGDPGATNTLPAFTPWVQMQTQLATVLVPQEVTRIVYQDKVIVVTIMIPQPIIITQLVWVTQIITTTPEPSQTPWIITVMVTPTFTLTPTTTFTPSPTETPTDTPETSMTETPTMTYTETDTP
jgi:flagellar basal body-associated protein FliL